MLYENTLTFMQRLQFAAARGNYYYINGEIDLSKFERLARKFATIYGTELPRKTKYKRRHSGEATATLYAVRRTSIVNLDGEIPVYWVLIVSSGYGRINEREQLKDLRSRDSRLTFSSKYELVHDGKTWSWKMTSSMFQKYQDRIHSIASLPVNRRKIIEIDGIRCDYHAEKLQDQLYGEPGFRLIRRQVGWLVSQLRGEWGRLRPLNGPQPSKRTYLPYIQFFPNKPPRQFENEPEMTNEERRALFRAAFGDG
ncbi:hypothetical protein [Chromobacterium sp. Panama]|uniref:hypothetical protein n=1 Tax=Chromobacterium sp. Panama TaxID=2161826 RepID=UPI0011B1E659|nr:hypothetical protein [Chromobacterium sp. Panama]